MPSIFCFASLYTQVTTTPRHPLTPLPTSKMTPGKGNRPQKVRGQRLTWIRSSWNSTVSRKIMVLQEVGPVICSRVPQDFRGISFKFPSRMRDSSPQNVYAILCCVNSCFLNTILRFPWSKCLKFVGFLYAFCMRDSFLNTILCFPWTKFPVFSSNCVCNLFKRSFLLCIPWTKSWYCH